MKKVLIFFISILSFACLSYKSIAQFSEETGFFPIINFTKEDYNNAQAKNSAIVQDKRGIMYFGNDEGILEYDGISWKLYYVSNETPVQSLGIDPQKLTAQSLITPSCGTGSLSVDLARKALELTREISREIRARSRA